MHSAAVAAGLVGHWVPHLGNLLGVGWGSLGVGHGCRGGAQREAAGQLVLTSGAWRNAGLASQRRGTQA